MNKRIPTQSSKQGVLPRTILATLNRIRRELDPRAEAEIIQDFRTSKVKTIISIKIILLLIIVPLLTHQISKTFIVGPIVDHFRTDKSSIFLNIDLEKEAIRELQRFEERLRFSQIIGKIPELSEAEKEEQIKYKVREIAEQYRNKGTDAIKNVFSDLMSILAFVVLIFTNKREIDALKSFMDRIAYGLSDSAKAFIIILFTDMFVGFHSPHGWEVLLDRISRHLGLPANQDFIFLFIATFPVILDTVFKYWIFRYLSRISPSAEATYREMNDA